MSDIRNYINLVEATQAELDEALNPVTRTIAGGLMAAGAAAGGMGIKDKLGSAPTTDQVSSIEDILAKDEAERIMSGKPQIKVKPGQTKVVATAPSAKPAAPVNTAPPATAQDKQAFVQKMLPLIKANNQKLLALRQQVQKIVAKKQQTKEEIDFLDGLLMQYRVSDGDYGTLVARINVIPPSLVLAQSAIESGWGKSRLAQAGNVMFGQKTTGAKSVDATEDGTRYAAFDGPEQAVESYMRNLNSHPAYKKFRAARNYLLQKGHKLKGETLAQYLGSYSSRGEEYTGQIEDMIASNGFDRYDG